MKILCMCQGGNSRSVGCAYLLKYKYSVDALAAGWEKNTEETLKMLCGWADYVFIMQEEFRSKVPAGFESKVVSTDVGPDVWFNSLHPDLLAKCSVILDKILIVTTVSPTTETIPQEATDGTK